MNLAQPQDAEVIVHRLLFQRNRVFCKTVEIMYIVNRFSVRYSARYVTFSKKRFLLEKNWTVFQTSFKLCLSYSVPSQPVLRV